MDLGLSVRGCALFLLVPVAAACGDDVSENLPDGDFTSTGQDTFPPITTTGQPTSNSGDPTTDSTTESMTESTTDGTTMGADTGTTVEVTATDSSTTGDPSTSSTGDPSTSSTGGTTDATDGSTGSSSTGGAGACGDDNIDDGEVCFAAGVSYAVGGSDPIDVVAGDFDDDGNVDIATANATSDNVSVLLGAGDGTLGNATEFGVGDTPTRIQAGNLSGDANDDLVTANTDGNDISVLIADGNGGFANAVGYDVGTGPVDLALGDLTGDGVEEVAVANPGSSDYSTLSNDGAGVLTVLGPWESGAVVPSAIALGDLADAGAGQDVWFGGGGAYGASPGLGDGTINDGLIVAGNAGSALLRAAIGDADNDGFIDVVTTDDGAARVFLNNGLNNAQFTSTGLTTGTDASEALFGDVTGEGDLDIIVSNAGDDTISIYVGDGTGTFPTTATETLDCGNAPSGLAIADLNEDNVADIICAGELDDEVTVLLSNP